MDSFPNLHWLKNMSDLKKHAKSNHWLISRFALSALCLITLASSCKQNSDHSKVNEFENSEDICKDIDQHTKNKMAADSSLNGLSIFHSKRLTELAIVNDLIKTYDSAKQNRIAPELKGAADSNKPLDEASICESVAKINPSGPPDHFNSLSSGDEFDKGIAFYCMQKSSLEAQKCTFTGTASKACGNLGSERPQWITESCEVVEAGLFKGVDALAKESCKLVPKLLQESKPKDASGACGSAMIGTVCTAHAKGILDVAKYLNREAGGGPADQEAAFTRNVNAAFSALILECLKSAAENIMADAIKSGATQGSAWWAGQVLDPKKVNEAVTGIKNPPSSIAGQVLKEAGLALCSAAGRAIAESINEAPSSSYKSYCGERTPKESQAWMASCFRTAADGCSSLAGNIDFGAIYKSASDSDPKGLLTKAALDTANLSVKTLCGVGGNSSKVACGVISSATTQIIQAVRSGNNSWAECAGTAKLGGCAGEKIASWMTGVTTDALDAPIDVPKVVNGHKESVCCQCQRDYYQNDWGFDTLYRKDIVLKGVTSNINNGADQSLCTKFEKNSPFSLNWTRDGYETYTQYSSCHVIQIFEASNCSLDSGPAYMQKQKFRVNSISSQKFWEATPEVTFGTMLCLDDRCY